MLRSDLCLSTDERTGEHLLFDPITRSEFVLTRGQRAIVERSTWPRNPAGDVAEFLKCLSDLCLLEPAPPADEIIDRQREQRRCLVAAVQRAKFDAQLSRLRDNVPFYRDWLSGVDPRWRFDELARMPCLTKSALRASAADPLAMVPVDRSSASPPTLELTSGTTAERFHLAADPAYRERMVDALAVRNRHVRDVFTRIRDVRVCYICSPLFDDDEVPLGEHGRALPRQRCMRRKRTLRFDAPGNIFTLPSEKLDQMIAEARAFAPGIFFGDPVHLSVLASHVRATRARLPRLEFVMTAFELCSDVSRKIIQDVFDCPVYDLYSATEFASAAVECDRGQYHVYDEAFIVEILAGGRPVAPGGLGQVVVTTLEKTCAPLLRYETGDLARTSPVPCSCAFSHCVSLSSIEGRVQDVISDATGAMVTPRAVDRAVPGEMGFLFYGLVQVFGGRYLLQIIPDDRFSPATTRRLGDRLHELLGPSACLDVETVPFLTPAPSGKFRLSRALHEGRKGQKG